MQYFCWLKSETTFESLHKMYILSDDPVAVSNTAEHFQRKLFAGINSTAPRV